MPSIWKAFEPSSIDFLKDAILPKVLWFTLLIIYKGGEIEFCMPGTAADWKTVDEDNNKKLKRILSSWNKSWIELKKFIFIPSASILQNLFLVAGKLVYKPAPPSTSSSCPFDGFPSSIGIAFVINSFTPFTFKELSWSSLLSQISVT